MGLLDELRKQSTDLKKSNADEAARQAELLEIYQAKIHPAMASIYTHVNELLEHLNFVKPSINAVYSLTASGEKRNLKQHSYTVNTDSSEMMQQIIVTFYCTNDESIEFEVENKQNIEKHVEFMQRHKLRYTSQQYRDDSYDVSFARFKLECRIKVSVIIEGDIENSCIYIKFNNFQELGLLKREVKANQVDENFLDEMGKYIVRESTQFMTLDLTSDEKRRLQQKLKKERLHREMELLEAERKQKEIEAEEAKKKSMFSFLDKGKNKK